MKTISQKKSVYIGMFLLSIFSFTSCEEDTPELVNEEELITTVMVTLKSGSQTIVLKYTDLDGDGPNAPVFSDYEKLTKNTVYTGEVSFLNESVDPSEDITEEVLAEAEEHQVFYQAPTAFGTFAYDDTDADGKPIGLEFTFTTGSTATSGNLRITLIHEPNKSGIGVAEGMISNAGGDKDIEVDFPVQIQ